MRKARGHYGSGPFGRTIGASDGVHRVGLRAFLALGDLELDPLAFFEALVAVGLDGAVVNEDVTTAVYGDEAVALLGVEPLDRALCHNDPRLLDSALRAGRRNAATPRGARLARNDTRPKGRRGPPRHISVKRRRTARRTGPGGSDRRQ